MARRDEDDDEPKDPTATRMRRRRRASTVVLLIVLVVTASLCVVGVGGDTAAAADDDVDDSSGGDKKGGSVNNDHDDHDARRSERRETPGERRAKLERALGSMFPGRGGNGRNTTKHWVGAGGVAPPRFYTPPPGRLGAVGGTAKREKAFEAWVREPVPTRDVDENTFGPAPFVGPVEVRSIWGRGRGVVTTRDVTRGETLMELPLLKCLSTASARGSAIGPALAAITSRNVTIDAVIALHLLHELHVQKARSPWWPWLSILPRDIESPVLWLPKELAQLEGSNLIGFRDAVLKGWSDQRAALVPSLTRQFPHLFPEQHFRASRFVWAMACVWSRAAEIPVSAADRPADGPAGGGGSRARSMRVVVPLLDMFNHGYEYRADGDGDGGWERGGDGGGGGGGAAAALKPVFYASRGMVVVKAGVSFPGPGYEIRFNYGHKPSQYVLLQYGFVPMNNPDECVEVALHMKKTDKLRREKLALLAKHDLSAKDRNFHFFPRRLDADLLAVRGKKKTTKNNMIINP